MAYQMIWLKATSRWLLFIIVTSYIGVAVVANASTPGHVRYFRGDLSAPSGSNASNPCVENVIEAVKHLQDRGESLGFNLGDNYPDVQGCGTTNHWQGIQRLPSMGLEAPYLVVSSSHRYRTLAPDGSIELIPRPAYFAVVKMASRRPGDGRLRSNRLAPGTLTREVSPGPLDFIVKANRMTPEFDHAGAMQTIGNYLLVGVEGHITHRRNTSLFMLWDMSAPESPRSVWSHPGWELPGRYAGSVGIARLENGKYLMLRALKDAKQLEFYVLDSNIGQNPASYLSEEPWAIWHYGALRSELVNGDGSLDLGWADLGGVLGRAGYQNTNIVTECGSGRLYLIASHGRRPSGLGSGADFVEAYRLDIPVRRPRPGRPGVVITKVASRRLYPKDNSGERQGDLQAAAGVYVSQDHRLFFYATEHGVSGKGHFVTMIEFGPEIPKAKVETIDDAWVELYDEPHFGGRSLILDYADRKLRDYNRLARVEEFDDLASSATFAIPRGHALRLYDKENQGGGYVDLIGTGRAERVPDLGTELLSDGENADNRISSLRWVALSGPVSANANPVSGTRWYVANTSDGTAPLNYRLVESTSTKAQFFDFREGLIPALFSQRQSSGPIRVSWLAGLLALATWKLVVVFLSGGALNAPAGKRVRDRKRSRQATEIRP